ncbi:MarR family winged helix-turn-helix transcriptional regulator [Aromatoleum aromaticum]|uniref:Transcriptional regulator (MarR family) n=1 Tax=Aromatoleum aromaticum (strain DSM 19018 / LMG 30748 / EbN1) TaxID=76114 RepID=Q5P3P6_AROAE|nr:MarR family transcriptional regulator [Aromatoleum aromaticum]NMG54376.1 MarR family transcriptional regulator [Aromatoleum aromaticum]CAI08068.1 transcriptional regulator (MarR family) [Aromatoleum aromaticum EbN1]
MGDSANPRFYDGNNYQVNDSIGFLMRQIVSIFSTVIDDRMAAHGLTDAQWKPLIMIQQGQCRTAAELSRLACFDAGAMTRLIDRVEAKGLVRRVRSQEDRRVVNLELTDEGERATEVVPHVLADVLNTALDGFSENEARQLKALLRRMLDNTRKLRESDAAQA